MKWKFQKRLNLIIARNQFLHLIVLIMQRFSILAFFSFILISYASEWYRFETRLSMQMRFSFGKKASENNLIKRSTLLPYSRFLRFHICLTEKVFFSLDFSTVIWFTKFNNELKMQWIWNLYFFGDTQESSKANQP